MKKRLHIFFIQCLLVLLYNTIYVYFLYPSVFFGLISFTITVLMSIKIIKVLNEILDKI